MTNKKIKPKKKILPIKKFDWNCVKLCKINWNVYFEGWKSKKILLIKKLNQKKKIFEKKFYQKKNFRKKNFIKKKFDWNCVKLCKINWNVYFEGWKSKKL